MVSKFWYYQITHNIIISHQWNL